MFTSMIDFRLVFNGPTDMAPLNSLRGRIVDILAQVNFGSLTVVFSSEGGSVTQALSFCEFLSVLPYPVPFHGLSSISSAAIPIFLSAKARTCTPTCRFMFHAFDYGFGPGSQTPALIEQAQLQLDTERTRCKEITRLNSTIPSAALDGFYNRHTMPSIVDATQAKVWGMVQDVFLLNPTGVAQPNVAVWTVGW